MRIYMNKLSDKLWNIFELVWKMTWYTIAVIIMFRILQANWLVFMLICIIIFMAFPKSFKD